MKKNFISIVRTHLFYILIFASFSVLDANEEKQPLSRSVLVLYEDKYEWKRIHRNLEMPFNYLGINLIYRKYRNAFDTKLPPLLGAMVWPSTPNSTVVDHVHKSIKELHKRNIKLMIFGNIPAMVNENSGIAVPMDELNQLYAPFKLELEKGFLRNPLLNEIKILDKKFINFEREFEYKGYELPIVKSLAKDSEKFLTVGHKYMKNKRSDLVFDSEKLSVVLNPALVIEDPKSYRKKWVLNPFNYIVKSLKLKERPIPDISTINGVRSIYCHIDGDAFHGVCRFDKDQFCGEIVYNDVLKKYKFPHTLSLVHIWLDPGVKEVALVSVKNGKRTDAELISVPSSDREKWTKLAREMFKQPWVENALHGYGHPLFWQKKIFAIEPVGKPLKIEDEFDKSLDVFTKHISSNSANIFLWTGDCFPSESTLKYVKKKGLRNMNGGDTLFDRSFDSYSHVAPYYRSVGDYFQIYTSASNENIYTNEWSGPFGGFRNVIKTFERTESPRRICPVNIYYHWYSGEREASLNALIKVYEWANAQFLTPIFGGQYIEIVHGFISAEITKEPNGWLIKKNNALRTIRFDDEKRFPVVSIKNNVLGYKVENNTLYVHLGSAAETKIELVEMEEKKPMLKMANAMVNSIEYKKEGLKVDAWSIRESQFTFSNLNKKISEQEGIKVRYYGADTIITVKENLSKKFFLKWISTD